jgi:YHS domain-containing protein
MLELARERPISPLPLGESAHRDPVCGMAIAAGAEAAKTTYDRRSYLFCSEACRARFLASPKRYLSARMGAPFAGERRSQAPEPS